MTGWLRIDDPDNPPPADRDVCLAAYIVPSDEAARNGSRPSWTYGVGREIYPGHWSGILGAQPSHWMPIEAPEK